MTGRKISGELKLNIDYPHYPLVLERLPTVQVMLDTVGREDRQQGGGEQDHEDPQHLGWEERIGTKAKN